MKVSTKWKIMVVVGVVTCLIVALGVAAYNKKESTTIHPANLGPRLEYIGKHYYGCILWWCEAPSSTDYYFATDMTQEELKTYFKGAKATGVSSPIWSDERTFDSWSYKTVAGEEFWVTYYNGVQPTKVDRNLKPTTKPYVISLTDYNLAKSAL